MRVRVFTFSVSLAAMLSCTSAPARPQARMFPTPDDAVKGLIEAVKAKTPEPLTAVFGPDAKDLLDAGDPGAGQRARQVFKVAVAERWHLEDQGTDKVLVIGNEDWPFPIRSSRTPAAGTSTSRRVARKCSNRQIGRNELGTIRAIRTYIAAQRLYAKQDTTASLPAFTREPSAASPDGRTASIGRPRTARSGARSAIWWRRPLPKGGRPEPASSGCPSTATTTRS